MKNRKILASGGLLALVAVAACSSPAPEGTNQGEEPSVELTVFAAASLQEAFDDLLEQFGEQHPEAAINPAVYDGSSTLIAQLEEGAEADVLATANEATMDDALEAGIIQGETTIFAKNDLVIAVPEDNPHGVEGFDDVLSLSYAVCAAQVPCGDATAQLFEAAGQTPAPISEEQNVTSVANRVSAGEVDAGFIYSTDVAARPELTAIPADGASIVNKYPIGATSGSEVGADFIDFVLSEHGLALLEEYGFGQP